VPATASRRSWSASSAPRRTAQARFDERGTYEFQSQFVTSQLAEFAATPWLSGAIYWTLQDFLVRPGWSGGNPYPSPPVFHKGLLDFNGAPKPAWTVVQQAYQATNQVG